MKINYQKRCTNCLSNTCGFTLIEVLVTVLVIGILAAIAVPYYQTAVDKSRFSSLMPIAKTVKDAQESFWLERGGQYSNDLGLLATSVTREAQGTTATLGDVTVEINNSREYSYVKTNKPGLNNNYVYYQDHSVNYPGEIHCEALEDDARAERVCKAFDGVQIQGYLTEGYVTYVLKGPGNGIPLSVAADLEHSSGGWQSCDTYPCTKECTRDTKAGYTCNGTYNEDHSYSELVCTTTALTGQQACVKIMYDENGKKIQQTTCEVGDGTSCNAMTEFTYDENGYVTFMRYCESYAEDGSCSAYAGGYFMTYDTNGNMTSEGECEVIADDGTCGAYSWSTIYTYDANGNQTSDRSCGAFDNSGECTRYDGGLDWTYDANGNKVSMRNCLTIESDGTCSEYYSWNSWDYMYDANGNMITECECNVAADGSCECALGYTHGYDANGNETSWRQCISFNSDGICNGFAGGYDYGYDANGNQIWMRQCQVMASDGTCTEYATYLGGTIPMMQMEIPLRIVLAEHMSQMVHAVSIVPRTVTTLRMTRMGGRPQSVIAKQ